MMEHSQDRRVLNWSACKSNLHLISAPNDGTQSRPWCLELFLKNCLGKSSTYNFPNKRVHLHSTTICILTHEIKCNLHNVSYIFCNS